MAQSAVNELMGIGGSGSPSATQQLMSPSGIQVSPSSPMSPVAPTQQQPSSLDLQSELAAIQGMRQSQGGGIGQTVGGLAGTGAGAYFGGPQGAAAGQAAGSTVGSIVDYIINSSDNERAQRKREQALIAEAERQKAIKTSQDTLRAMAERKGIALSREEEAMQEQDVVNQMRRSTMSRILSMINQEAQQDEFLKNKFLKSRSVG